MDHDVGGAHVLEERVLVEEARAVPDGHGAGLTPEPGHENILWEVQVRTFPPNSIRGDPYR